MYRCVMFDIDENGNEINELLIEDEKPEKIYKDRCEYYGDIRDAFRTLRHPQPKPLSTEELAFQRWCD